MNFVRFASTKKAVQFLSDYTGKRVIIAVEDWYNLPMGDELIDKIEAIYELEYKFNTLKSKFKNSKESHLKRYQNILIKMEKLIREIASDIADDLIEVFEEWLSRHALLSADSWANARVKDQEEMGGSPEDMMDSIKGEYQRYVKGNFESAVIDAIGKHIDDSSGLKQWLSDFGDEEKNQRIEQAEEEGDEDFDESDLDHLDSPEGAWEYLSDMGEAMTILPDYVREDLAFLLYKNLVFPAWLEHWSAQGIEETRDRVEETNDILHSISKGSVSNIGDIIVGINRALNEAHQTGEMLEYIDARYNINKSELDDLSNREVSDWNKELGDMGFKVASKEYGMKEENDSVYYDSEEEALQHLADVTQKSIKIPAKDDPTVEGMTTGADAKDFAKSLSDQGAEVKKKFDEAASAVGKALGDINK